MTSIPLARSAGLARSVAQSILAAGYTEARMIDLGLTKTPWKESPAKRILPYKVTDAALESLIRLYFFGERIRWATLSSALPSAAEEMIACGMLDRVDEWCVPNCMLVHHGGMLLACDSVRRAAEGPMDDLVLGVNRPTQILGHCILPLPRLGSALDLGTGCGTLGLQIARNAGRVTGTDINPRALQFAAFNAALNGLSNFSPLQGDRFDPVQQDQFDLIVSNPPFFLTGESKLLFTQNPFMLDGFVESLARQAPLRLKEGGCFQMLCEWVEFNHQPWRDRIQEWFHHSGCDVLVLEDYEIDPADYALLRTEEASALEGAATEESIRGRVQDFVERGIKTIHGGLVTIRKSTVWPDGKPKARNWFVADKTGGKPANPIGDLLLERFTNEDLLNSESDSRLLTAYPRLSRDIELVQRSVQENKRWNSRILYLERKTDLPRRLSFDAELAGVLGKWDGSEDLGSHASAYARMKNVPKSQAAQDLIRFARKLASLGLITFDGARGDRE